MATSQALQPMEIENNHQNSSQQECNGTQHLFEIPQHLLGFIGSFIDIFHLYELMKTSKSMYLLFINEPNNSTMRSCIRNVFDDEWLQLALCVNERNMNKAIQWLYQDTLIYRQCHEYKTTINARNNLQRQRQRHHQQQLSIENTPKRRHSDREIIGRLIHGAAADVLLRRSNNDLFHLSSLHSHETIILLFRNGSSTHQRALRWVWIDSDGVDRDYTSTMNNIIQPNRAIWQPTFPTHPWKLLDPNNNNRVLAIYIPESNYPLHEIIIQPNDTVTVVAGNGGSVM